MVRARVLAAARAVAGRRGLGDTGMREIAREAGVALGTLYNYFPDRDALALAVVEDAMHRGQRQMSELGDLAGEGPVADILIPRLVDVAVSLGDLLPVLGSALASADLLERLHGRLQRVDHPAVGRDSVASYLQAEQAIGRIRPGVDCVVAAEVLLGVCHHYAFVAKLLGAEDSGSPAPLEAQLRLVIDGLTA